MKKLTLITSLLLFPCLLFAQSYGSGSAAGILFAMLFGFAVALGIFLVIRELVLWYWKVNKMLSNQEIQINEQRMTNQLLRQQNELLAKRQPEANNHA